MKSNLLTILIIIFCSISVNAQRIEWLSLEEALEKQKEKPRKIIIDAYTEWCGWCKNLDRTTFANPDIANYINSHFYAVKFDAETTDTIEYLGQKYINSVAQQQIAANMPVRRATHDLTYKLMGERISFPTLIYLDDSAKVLAPISGYYSAADIQPFLLYFAEDLYYASNLQDFIDDFKYTFVDSLRSNVENVKWLSLAEAQDLNKKEPRKLLLCMDAPWATTSKIMMHRIYNDVEVAEYINTNFYPVRFDITSQDSVVFKDYVFKNQSTEHPFHDFAVNLLRGNMNLPATIFFTSELNPITNVDGYFSRSGIMPVLQFFSKDFYQKLPWQVYIKQYPEILKTIDD